MNDYSYIPVLFTNISDLKWRKFNKLKIVPHKFMQNPISAKNGLEIESIN